MAAYCSTLLCLCFLSCGLAAKFVMIPMFGRSHYIFVAKLGQELAERGHEVTIFVGNSMDFAAKDPNVWMFNDEEFLRRAKNPGVQETSFRSQWSSLLNLQDAYCDGLLSNAAIMKHIEKADLVVGELIYLCSSLVVERFSLPLVILVSSTLTTPTAVVFGLPLPPSYVPLIGSLLTDKLTFVERVQNTLLWISLNTFIFYDTCRTFADLKTRHNITPHRSIQETFGKADLIISQRDFNLEYPRPLLPMVDTNDRYKLLRIDANNDYCLYLCYRRKGLTDTRVVGPFLPSPPKPLPDELEKFVQTSGAEGVIAVSFGTVVNDVFKMDDSVLQMMATTFSKLPQKVIWKLKLSEGSKISLGKNTKLMSWLPQNDILGHHKTRLFIGHAGLNGLLESTYHGVPMICAPFFGDQFDNAQTAKHVGFGEVLQLHNTSVDEFVGLIRKVLSEPSYRESAARISRAVKLLPRHPVKEAADWVEYTQAQGGLPYLRPRGLDLPFYQLYLLDVLLVVLLVLVAAFFVARFLLKALVNCLFRSQKKDKTN